LSASVIPQFVLPAALFTIMLGLGLTLKVAHFRQIMLQPRALFTGLLLQLIALPLLGWLVVTVFALPPVLAMGILILTLAPGGATSNLITLLARGDTALSVSLTAITSLITPFTLPFIAAGFFALLMPDLQGFELPVGALVMKLVMMSLLPVVLGMWFSARLPQISVRLAPWVERISMLFVALAVVLVVSVNRDRLGDILIQVGPAVLSLIMLASLLALAVARHLSLSEAQSWTLSIEVGIQNAATAMFVTASVLQRPDMAATALAYGVLMNIPALCLIIYRRTRREVTA